MPRITPLPSSKFPVGARLLTRVTKRMFGQAPASIAVTAHSPGLVWSAAWMDRFFVGRRSVPNRLVELVSVRTAMELGCPFCMDLGSYVAVSQHGVTGEELAALGDHPSSTLFTAAERAAFDLAVAMSATPPTADDALYARLAEHFDERQIVELTAAVAWENYRSRVNLATGMTAQGYSEPGMCAVPAGAAAGSAAPSAATTTG